MRASLESETDRANAGTGANRLIRLGLSGDSTPVNNTPEFGRTAKTTKLRASEVGAAWKPVHTYHVVAIWSVQPLMLEPAHAKLLAKECRGVMTHSA